VCWVKGTDEWERWARAIGLVGVGVQRSGVECSERSFGLLVCWQVGELGIVDLSSSSSSSSSYNMYRTKIVKGGRESGVRFHREA